MRYFIAILGFLSIILVTIINFYPDESKEFVESILDNKEFIIAKKNEYYLDNNFSYVQNFTDDVSNKQELINYIY